MRLATPLKIASAVVFGAGLATYARYRREMRQRITGLPQNGIGRWQAGAAVVVSRIIVPWLHRYRAGQSYKTRPGRPHSELQRKSVHSAGRFARGLAHAYDSSARYELVPLLPRELPSGAAPVLARIFDLPKLLIYNEILVDALGLEPRTR